MEMTPDTPCVECGKITDATTGMNVEGLPKAGDIAVCYYCGHLTIYTNDLMLREPTAAELYDCSQDEYLQRLIVMLLKPKWATVPPAVWEIDDLDNVPRDMVGRRIGLVHASDMENIPAGTKLVSIMGDVVTVGVDPIAADDRQGYLAYGVPRAWELPQLMYRSSGDMVCPCGKEYWRHPAEQHDWELAAESPATFHRICNGDLVKL